MSSNIETLTCLECGEEVDSELLELHMEQIHGEMPIRGISKAEQRLLAKKSKSSSVAKIAAGIVMIVIILLAANFVFLSPSDSTSNDITGGYHETEEQPDIVSVPEDDGDDDSGTGGSGDGGDDPGNYNNDTDPDPDPYPDPGELAIQLPTDEVTTDAKWYPYDSDGVEIRFFAVRSNDNEIHVAFDACDVCYEAKMGYVQDGIKMTCNNCGKSFPIKAIGTDNKSGGCWPSYLPISIQDDNIIIKISDLENNRYMFE